MITTKNKLIHILEKQISELEEQLDSAKQKTCSQLSITVRRSGIFSVGYVPVCLQMGRNAELFRENQDLKTQISDLKKKGKK